MFTNHRPKIMGTDFGIWRRVHLWPFSEKFADPADPANPLPGEKDKHILDKLRPEHPAILGRWVRGALEWQRLGLKPPETVLAATKEYQKESDLLGDFIEECCELGTGYEVSGSVLYGTYRLWAHQNGCKPLGNWKFSERITDRDGIDHIKGRTRTYTGLSVEPEWRAKFDASEQKGRRFNE